MRHPDGGHGGVPGNGRPDVEFLRRRVQECSEAPGQLLRAEAARTAAEAAAAHLEAELEEAEDEVRAGERRFTALRPYRATGVWSRLRGGLEARRRDRATDLVRAHRAADEIGRALLAVRTDAEEARRAADAARARIEMLPDALDALEVAVRRRDPDRCARLDDIAAACAPVVRRQRELREAHRAAMRAEDGLRRALATLDEAYASGTWDLFGGGLLASLSKHESLDAADDDLRLVARELRVLRAELEDVDLSVDLASVPALTRVLDVWFDNVLTDFSVQGRIEDAAERTIATGREVARLRGVLREQLHEAEGILADLTGRRTAILLGD
jgi:hypothetical protein